MTTPRNTGLPHGLQARLKTLVLDLKKARGDEAHTEVYRGFVIAGVTCGLSPAAYKEELIAAKLKASRASEIARIVSNPQAAADFTREAKPISWRAALRLARGMAPSPAAEPKSPLKQLEAAAGKLIATRSIDEPWVIDCGLFRLKFEPTTTSQPVASPPAEDPEPDITVVIPLGPQTYEQLDCLAHWSGLSCRKTALILLQRAAESRWLAVHSSDNPPSLVEKKFSLPRRKNPARNPEDVHRLPVKMPSKLVEWLDSLGASCGLSRNEVANILLEPQPDERIETIWVTLSAVAQSLSQK